MAPTTDKLTRMLDKIAKLLAKAEATTYPAEAEAFTEHAERLMIRYGIGKAEVDAERGRQGQTREPIVEKRTDFKGLWAATRVEGIGDVLLSSGLVTVLQSKSRDFARLFVIGAESDVDQMLRLADSLVIQQEAALVSWWATVTDKSWMTQAEQRRERREFVRGWYVGASLRLQDVVGQEATGGKELVLADRKQRADAWVGEQYPDIKAARAQKIARGSAEASRAGVAAGKSADVNGRKLAGAAMKALA
jgi:hypothetical protein